MSRQGLSGSHILNVVQSERSERTKVMVQQPIRGRVHGFRGIAALGIVLFITQSFLPAQTPDKEVLPILQRCYQCHGETLQMSKLDLRTRAAMLKGGASGPAIVPGD